MIEDTTKFANSVFEQPWFLNVVAKGKWIDLKVEENGQIIARWPICYNGRKIFMPIQTQTLGPWIKSDLKHSKLKSVINELVNQFPKAKSTEIMLDPSLEYFLPFRWLGYEIRPRITYRINNLDDLEKVKSNFDKTVKKNIKSASNKTQIVEETDTTNLYNLICETFQVQNRSCPFSKEFVDNLCNAAFEHNAGKILTAIDEDNNVHASAFFIFDEKNCYYLLAGSSAKYRSSGAQTLVIWHGIQFAQAVSKCFDFEGSMIEGIENFVRRFGGERTLYFQITKKSFLGNVLDLIKPKIKKIIGYKN